MKEIQAGQIVFSKAGHDKNGAFVAVTIDGEYAYLSDGTTRKLASPKKKKLKHIRPTNTINEPLRAKLTSNTAQDADVANVLKTFAQRAEDGSCKDN